MNIDVKVMKMNQNAEIPSRGSVQSAGYDLYNSSQEEIEIKPGENVKIHTGLAMEIPDGTCALILPRSGIASKKNLAPINAPGLCDSDYRGEYMVALHNYGNVPQIVTPGERIAQVVFINYLSAAFEQVNSLEDTDRGTNGFGSTGTK